MIVIESRTGYLDKIRKYVRFGRRKCEKRPMKEITLNYSGFLTLSVTKFFMNVKSSAKSFPRKKKMTNLELIHAITREHKFSSNLEATSEF
jgi:hypothetical protein